MSQVIRERRARVVALASENLERFRLVSAPLLARRHAVKLLHVELALHIVMSSAHARRLRRDEQREQRELGEIHDPSVGSTSRSIQNVSRFNTRGTYRERLQRWATQIGLGGKPAPPSPLAAGGRLTLNT